MAQSNSNSKILQNDVNRSVFGYKKCLKSSQHMGNLAVQSIELALPGDTFKTKRSAYYELKPTTHRIATQIKSHDLSVAVPFSSIMRYWDEFISKGDNIVQTGGFNVPFIQNDEDKSVKYLPFTTPISILGKMLACFSQTSSSAPSNLNNQLWKAVANGYGTFTYANRSDFNGNVMPYSFGEVSDNGAFSYVGGGYNMPWWFPRLAKQGVANGINYHNHAHSGAQTLTYINLIGEQYASLASYVASLIQITNPSVTWSGVNNSNTVGLIIAYYHDTTNGWLNFSVGVTGSGQTNPYRVNYSNGYDLANDWTFKVSTISDSTRKIGDFYFRNATTTGYTGTITAWTIPYLSSSTTSKRYSMAVASAALSALFQHSSLFGYGSLAESMGHHFFEEIRYVDALTNYIDPSFTVNYYGDAAARIAQSESTVTLLNSDMFNYWAVDAQELNRMFILPYFAYQKVATDRFLLPHNILSNNQGQDSSVDTNAQYDSPYWRNNMVPTCYFGKPRGDYDVFDYDTVYLDKSSGSWAWARCADGSSTLDPQDWHYVVSMQQMLSVFLDRGYCMDLDMLSENWQKQDQNVTNLVSAAGYGVNADGTINAKSFLMAKKLGKMFWFGGSDQLSHKVIENQFGVNDVPDHCMKITILGKNDYTLDMKDVLNTGGAVDEENEPRPLGDRVSIVSNQIPTHSQFSAYIPEFSFLMDIHWFSVKTDRQNTPQPAVNAFDRILGATDVKQAFQLAFFAVFQTTGDDALFLSDVKSFAAKLTQIAWTNKNNWLKSGYCEYRGEWKDRYKRMIVTPHPAYRFQLFGPSLTYGYLMPAPYEYDLHLVDKYGDAFIYDTELDVFKKTSMTALNEVGLNI